MHKNIHIITSLQYGGTEKFLSSLFSNDNNHIVISLKKKSNDDVLFNKNIDIVYLNFSYNIFLNLFELIKLFKLLKFYKIQSLNLWLYHTFLIGTFLSYFLSNNKIIWHVRCEYKLYKTNLLSKVYLSICKSLLKINKNIIIVFNSKAALDSHITNGFSSINRIIDNGTDTNKFVPKENLNHITINNNLINKNKFNIGMLARFHPDKNHDFFFKVIKKFDLITKNYLVILAGLNINSSNHILMNMIKKYDLEKKIIILDTVKNIHELIPYLDLNVLTSNSESFPNSIIEAMSCSVPSIIPDIGNISHIIDDCGFVFKKNNSTDCYRKIKFFYENYYKNDSLHTLKIKNRNRVIKNYSMKDCLSKFKEVWK
jgi:glycosyltransferase involved in cell wall biosynthesis